MPFGMNAAALGAFSRNPRLDIMADDVWRRRRSSNVDNVDPEQNPQFVGSNPLQNFEAFGVNELFDVRNDQAADTLRSLSRVGDRAGMEQQVAEARNESGQAADVAEGMFNRRTEGMALTDRQRAGARQAFSLNRAVTQAAAGTGTRRRIADQARQADRAVTGFEDIAFGQQLGGLAGLANAEGQRRVNEANARANKKASRNGLIGSIVSLIGGIFSAEEYKDQTEEKPKLLDKLKEVRVDRWRYKGSKAEHIGPYAEEFNETFGVGRHKDSIDVVDILGVTLGSLKELNEKVEKALA